MWPFSTEFGLVKQTSGFWIRNLETICGIKARHIPNRNMLEHIVADFFAFPKACTCGRANPVNYGPCERKREQKRRGKRERGNFSLSGLQPGEEEATHMAWNFYFLLSRARNCFSKTPYTVSWLILCLFKSNTADESRDFGGRLGAKVKVWQKP